MTVLSMIRLRINRYKKETGLPPEAMAMYVPEGLLKTLLVEIAATFGDNKADHPIAQRISGAAKEGDLSVFENTRETGIVIDQCLILVDHDPYNLTIPAHQKPEAIRLVNDAVKRSE